MLYSIFVRQFLCCKTGFFTPGHPPHTKKGKENDVTKPVWGIVQYFAAVWWPSLNKYTCCSSLTHIKWKNVHQIKLGYLVELLPRSFDKPLSIDHVNQAPANFKNGISHFIPIFLIHSSGQGWSGTNPSARVAFSYSDHGGRVDSREKSKDGKFLTLTAKF